MKLSMRIFLKSMTVIVLSIFTFSCQKNADKNISQARLEVRLTDSPDPNVKEVWVDIKEVKIKMSDTSEIAVGGASSGLI